MVPTKTLGLSSDYGENNFGNKIAYIVDRDYTSSTTFATASTGIIGQNILMVHLQLMLAIRFMPL